MTTNPSGVRVWAEPEPVPKPKVTSMKAIVVTMSLETAQALRKELQAMPFTKHSDPAAWDLWSALERWV